MVPSKIPLFSSKHFFVFLPLPLTFFNIFPGTLGMLVSRKKKRGKFDLACVVKTSVASLKAGAGVLNFFRPCPTWNSVSFDNNLRLHFCFNKLFIFSIYSL